MNTGKEHILNRNLQKKSISNVTPFTLLDFPDRTACIVWFSGCNMRCAYCYNPDIVLGIGKYSFEDIRDFMGLRKEILDGVILSGGECLMHDSVFDITGELKYMGYLVKADTNGSRPEMLEKLLNHQRLDYVALDFKAPDYKYFSVTQSDLYSKFEASFRLLQNSKIDFEVRTTIHSSLLNIADIEHMADTLSSWGYQGNYYLQYFRSYKSTLGNPGVCSFHGELNDISGKNLKIMFR